MWQARVDLFRDIEKALEEDPAGDIAQALVARWEAQQNEASGGDSEIKAALLGAGPIAAIGRPRCAGKWRVST
jgi:hypothetical protein